MNDDKPITPNLPPSEVTNFGGFRAIFEKSNFFNLKDFHIFLEFFGKSWEFSIMPSCLTENTSS